MESNALDNSPISSLVLMFVLTSKFPLAISFAAFFSLFSGLERDFDITNAIPPMPMVITIPVSAILFSSIPMGFATSASSISASRTIPKSPAQYDEP